MTPSSAIDDSITVTTATRSEADVRASLEAEAPATDPKKPETPAAAAAPVVAAGSATPEQEAESERPDTDVSEAARTLRSHRASERVTRLRADIDLYRDNVARLGGIAPEFVKREYKKPSDEIDHLSRHRHELQIAINKALREGRTPAAAAPTDRPAAAQPGAARTPAASATPAAPTFTFPTWDDYQTKHPEQDYTEYLDARNDARAAFQRTEAARGEQERAVADRRTRDEQALIREQAAYESGVETMKATTPDFDAVLEAARIDPGTPPEVLAAVNRLVYRAGEHGPAIAYYLGKNPDDSKRLFGAGNMGELLMTFGEIKYAALRAAGLSASAAAAETRATAPSDAAAAAAPTPAPPKPVTTAPAPLSEIKAPAADTRSLQQLADDGQDADAYIARREAEGAGGRRPRG